MNLGDKDLTEVLQTVIDAPALQPYFHADQPGRTPLIVVVQRSGNLELQKFGQPVVLAQRPTPGKPFLEITRIEADEDACSVEFKYPAEGLKGEFALKRGAEGRWQIQKHELREN